MKFELGQVGGGGFKLFTIQHYAKWLAALVEPGKELRENNVGCIGDSITKKRVDYVNQVDVRCNNKSTSIHTEN